MDFIDHGDAYINNLNIPDNIKNPLNRLISFSQTNVEVV